MVNASAGVSAFGLSPEANAGIIGLLLIVIAVLVLWRLRHFIINSLLGIIALFLLQFVGIDISINVVTIIVAAVLGLIGVGLLVILSVLGFSF
ncbi:pro-sigmaK processing inhibitor BofA family protein [Candidatus Micrarchaeota archaeon]|nr:pro-sigmaK processing inhibitor BofA family protein [Candidatus Micrarchaeota archaeon]